MALKPLCMLHFDAAIALLAMCACQASNPDMLMADKHEKWISKFNRTYKDEVEKAMRLEVFRENAAYIEAFNQQAAETNKTYKLALNKFSDLTNQEFLARHTGYVSGRGSTSLSSKFAYAEVTEIPESIDWREKGAVTGVKNQGRCGNQDAVGHFQPLLRWRDSTKSSEFRCPHKNSLTVTRKRTTAAMEYAFMYIANNNGLTTEDVYQYQESSGTCRSEGLSPVGVSIDYYESVPSNNESSLMMAVANQPVSVSIDGADPDFQFYKEGVYNGQCGTEMNHAMTAVGYGVDSDGTKFWLLKNSWGPAWGENGYMRVKKDVAAPEGLCGLAIMASYPTPAA